jgi:glutamate-1-semialdehyde 2,1-aminomutase
MPSGKDLGSRDDPNVFPWTMGLPKHSRNEFTILPWNDLELVEETLVEQHHEIAAIITEPIMCNNGCILPEPGFLEGLRTLCDQYDIALVFDEVITGFRLSLGGAQSYFGVIPDLAIFAKAIANGYPISAVVGKRHWMKVVEESKVIHAGTINSGNAPVAAALATINVLEKEQPYEKLFRYGKLLMEGIRSATKRTGHNMLVTGPGPMFCTTFTDHSSIKDYRDTLSSDQNKLKSFVAAMHEEGIRIIGRGLWYISLAHNRDDIDRAVDTLSKVLKKL